MIIGHGNIAKVLRDRDGAIFFASGVSNSQCTDESEYQREKDLLKVLHNSYLSLFYFSSLALDTKLTRYYTHKIQMELLVKEHFKNYNIIRLGNLDWDENPHTFKNYIKANPSAPIRDEYKYMISKEQLLLLTDNLPLTGKNEISVFGEMKKVKDYL